MSAAGIIAHCLSGAPIPTSLVVFGQGLGTVNKIKGDDTNSSAFIAGGDNQRHLLLMDGPRQRVFSSHQSGVYIFEGVVANSAIPTPTLIANTCSLPSDRFLRTRSLDTSSGQAFFANGNEDTVLIINTDNTTTLISGVDYPLDIVAIGDGKFIVLTGNHYKIEAYGPSNSYAAPVWTVDHATNIGQMFYDPATDLITAYPESDIGGLITIEAQTGTDGFTDIGGYRGSRIHFIPETTRAIIDDTRTNGELFVVNPYTGDLYHEIDLTGEQGTSIVTGLPTEIQHIGNVVAVMLPWRTQPGNVDYQALHLFDAGTGAILNSSPLWGSGVSMNLIADAVSNKFFYGESSSIDIVSTEATTFAESSLTTWEPDSRAVNLFYVPDA